MTAILQRITTEWAMRLQPESILAVCREIGYTAWRDRVLTPVTTRQLFLLQILQGHTACSHLPHRSGVRCRAAASCQARARLPRRCFARLLARCGSAVPCAAWDDGRWHGHRPLCVDGSGGSMPDTPARQDAFGPPTAQRPGGGCPVARLLGLFHAGTGVRLKLVVAPRRTHDLARVQAVPPSVQDGEVLGADRGLCSAAPLALLVQAGVHAVRRVGARQMVDVTPGRPVVRPSVRRTRAVTGVPRSRGRKALGVDDPRVVWLQPTTWPGWLARETWAALPETLVRRAVRDPIDTPGFRTRQITRVTTWVDAEVDRVADLAARYRQRWQVDTALAHLKTTRPMAVRHGKPIPGVLQELTVFAIVDNLVRMVMCQSAKLHRSGVERSSVLEARRWRGGPRTGIP